MQRNTGNESTGISQEDLPQLQDRAAPRYCFRDLLGSKAQAAAGISEHVIGFQGLEKYAGADTIAGLHVHGLV
jgi:hypothetical protein